MVRPQTRLVVLVAAVLIGAALTTLRMAPPGVPSSDGFDPGTWTVEPSSAVPVAASSAPARSGAEPVADAERTEVRARAGAPQGSFRDEDRIRARAQALAAKLGLNVASEAALLDVLLEEQRRRTVAFAERGGKTDRAAADAQVRAELDAILVWKTKALCDRFGLTLATAMMRR